MALKNGMRPIHPGEILREDILPDLGLSVSAAAKALGISRQMLHDVLAERKPLSAAMCLKIARLLGSTPEFWMRLQAQYDLKKATRDKRVMERIAKIVDANLNFGQTRKRLLNSSKKILTYRVRQLFRCRELI